MKRFSIISQFLVLTVSLLAINVAAARGHFNDKLLNRPYADLRHWHLGFGVGTHTQDISFLHNDYFNEDGEKWYMEQPSFSPGFSVNGVAELRLNDYFSLRFTPGMYFGNREIKMVDITDESRRITQDYKSAYVVLPIDIKYAAQRYRNCRPYVIGGFMPAFDVAKKRVDYLKFKSSDLYLEVGLGCDFYLPYFKLIPELKFCFGLTDILQRDRPDLVDDPSMMKITNSLKRATSKMVVLTFYFE